METFIPVEQARGTVLTSARLCPPEPAPLAQAVGRTLAAPVVSGGPLPPFNTSAMDGYAVRLADLAQASELPLAGTVHAGGDPRELVTGTCLGVMTGAPLPNGAEAVVPVEWTSRSADGVHFDRQPEPGQSIRRVGSALAAGVEVLRAGDVVTVQSVGLLAAVGAATLSVRRRPVVAVVTTGDEVVPPDAVPGPVQIRDANGPALAAQVVAAGGIPLSLHAGDDRQSLSAALDRSDGADVLVFAGGVSMGEHDLVRPELERRGVEWVFWKVRQRPGKPLAFGHLGDRPVIGLPGNPVSAVACFEVYLRPLLAACLGRAESAPPETGRLAETVDKAEGLTTFLRVTASRSASGTLLLSPSGAQGSHVARSLLLSDGLAWLQAEGAEVVAGTVVPFVPWGG